MKKTYDDFWEEVADMAKTEGKAEGKAEGLSEGFSKGKSEGLAAKSKEVALNLLKQNISYDVITKSCGCTEHELALWAEEKAPEYK